MVVQRFIIAENTVAFAAFFVCQHCDIYILMRRQVFIHMMLQKNEKIV